VILTNYPFDRALVAERQRERLAEVQQIRRTGRHRGPGQKRTPTNPRSFITWLRGPATQSRGAAGIATAGLLARS
jgi:hypothetical protein